MNDIKIIGILGSPHKDGGTARLLQLAIDGAASVGAQTEMIYLYDLNIGFEDGSYSKDPTSVTLTSVPGDDMKIVYPKMIEADGFIFATPTYWMNMSAIMKNFIDRLTPLEHDGFHLKGKVAAFIGHSKENEGGVEQAVMSMIAPLLQMGVLIPPGGAMWHPGSWTTSSGESQSWAEIDAPKVGADMVRFIKTIRECGFKWSAA